MKRLFTLFAILVAGMWSVSAQTYCEAPASLNAIMHYPSWNNVRLQWSAAPDNTQQQIQWCTTTAATRIGLSTGPVNLTAAVRFLPSDLSNYTHHSITAVTFYPGESSPFCQYTIKIWRGGNHTSSFNPGTLVHSQVVTQDVTEAILTTVLLDSAVAINPNQELWIAVQGVTTTTDPAYPVGASSNTSGATDYQGELLNLGSSWMTLTQGSLTGYNWVIIGTVTDNDHIVDGYNVYRDNVLLTSSPLAADTYVESVSNGTYHYAVTAVYRTGCESDSVTANVTMGDNPCIDCMDSVFVSNGNTGSYRLPTSTYYAHSYSQQLYTAGEISRIDGKINCISFQYINTTPQFRQMKIYLANTSKSSFANSSDWVPIGDMTLVYDGSLYLHNGGPNYWINVPLMEPFEWNGSDNIVVAVLDNTGHNTTSTSNTFYVHSASGKSIYTQNTSTPINPATTSYSGSLGSVRSNIRFMVGDSITCIMPSMLQVSEISENSAVASWIPRGGSNSFDVVLVPEGSTLENEGMQTVTDTFFLMQGLTENTHYTFYVRSNCGGETSSWNTFSFVTNCLPYNALPYVENFEGIGYGVDVMPDCWLKSTTLNSAIHVDEDDDTSHHCLYMYSYANAPAYAVLPAADPSIDLGTLQVRFKLLKTSASYGNIEVGLMTDPRDVSTFVSVKSIGASQLASNNTWYDFIVYLSGYSNAGRYIAFKSPDLFTNYVYLDDVEVNMISGCGLPTNLQVVSTSGTAALLSWQPGDLSDISDLYNVEYSIQGLGNWQMQSTQGNQLFLSGLEPLTHYDVRLYVTCDNGVSDTLFATFSTRCISGGDISIGSGTTTSSYLPSYSFYNYSYTQQVYLASELNGPNTFHSISFNCSSLSSSPTRNYQIFLMHTNQTGPTSAWLPADSAKLVYTGNVTWHTGWNVIDLDSVFEYDGISNLALLVLDNTGSYVGTNSFLTHTSTSVSRYVYNDGSAYNPMNMSSTGSTTSSRNNIILGGICDSITTCVPPMVVVSDVAPHTAQVRWAPGYQEDSWIMEYRKAGDPWVSLGTQTATAYQLTNLLASNSYEVRLRSICADSTSDYTLVTFQTECEYQDTLPMMENFDQISSTGTTAYPDCWKRLYSSTTAYPYVSSSYSLSGNRALYVYNGGSANYAIGVMPRLGNAIAMDSLRISFYTRSTSTTAVMEVGVMIDPNDPASFSPLAVLRPSSTTNWESREVITRSYSGPGHYIAFRMPMGASSNMYVDDIVVDYLPECMHVMNLEAVEVDSASARIVWSPGRDEMDWQLVVLPTTTDSVDLDTCVTFYPTEASYLLDQLSPVTNYTVYVRANCGNTFSEWETVQFTTTQTPAFLPYVCTFETDPHNWALVNGTCSNGWYVDTAAHNGGARALYISNDGGQTNAYSSPACYVWAYRDIYFPASPNGYEFSFDWHCLGESSLDYVEVYFGDPATPTPGTSLIVPAGATSVTGKLNQSSTYQTYSTLLPGSATAGIKRLYFMWHNDGSVDNNPPAAIDNITIDLMNCPAPVNVYAYNVGPTSAVVTWAETGDATHWNLYYKSAAATSWTMVQDAQRPYTLTNLSEGITYSIYVEALCDPVANTTSPASFTNTFTTPYACPQPTGIVVSSITANGFTVNWTPAGNETQWTVSYRVNTASTWTEVITSTHPYNVTGLTGSTTYNVRVKANCSSTEESQWTDYNDVIVTQTPPCPSPTNVTVTNVTAHSADISWTQPDNSADAWRITFRKLGLAFDTLDVNTPSYSFTNLEATSRYVVRIYANCGNNNYSTAYVTTFTTLEEPDSTGIVDYLDQIVTVYPNPTDGKIMVQNNHSLIQDVEVYDAFGKMLFAIKVDDNTAMLNMTDYAAGMYFARISTSEGVITKRFIKK